MKSPNPRATDDMMMIEILLRSDENDDSVVIFIIMHQCIQIMHLLFDHTSTNYQHWKTYTLLLPFYFSKKYGIYLLTVYAVFLTVCILIEYHVIISPFK